MERIIAGRFETKGDADAAAASLAAFVDASDICIFHNNAPGQHDALPGIGGGDEEEDPEAKGAGTTSGGSAVAGGLAGAAIGAIGGPVGALAGAGIGAYSGSLVGALGGLGEADGKPVAPERRPVGVMLSVRMADPKNEDRVIAALRKSGAADIEEAQGTWAVGDWTDFDPVATPRLVGAAPA
jgi:hypothetical protein